MKNIFSFYKILFFTIMLVSLSVGLNAQVYHHDENEVIRCTPEECSINIDFDIDMVYLSTGNCEWQFDLTYFVDDPCDNFKYISQVEWKNITSISVNSDTPYGETEFGESTTFYVSEGYALIELSIRVKTQCGDITYKYQYSIASGGTCSGCTSSFCYNHIFKCEPQEPYYTQLTSLTLFDENYNLVYLNQTNNAGGIFHFPYYFYRTFSSSTCFQTPNMYTLIDDLNVFLNTSSNYGHAVLAFYCAGDPGSGGCKIRIRIKDANMLMITWKSETFTWDWDCRSQIVYNCDVDPGSVRIESTDCFPSPLAYNDDVAGLLSDFNIEYASVITDIPKYEDFGIEIHPTLCDDYIEISTNVLDFMKCEGIIMDMSGKLVKRFELDSSGKKLNISGYKNGMYFVKLYNTNTGEYKIAKFIKY